SGSRRLDASRCARRTLAHHLLVGALHDPPTGVDGQIDAREELKAGVIASWVVPGLPAMHERDGRRLLHIEARRLVSLEVVGDVDDIELAHVRDPEPVEVDAFSQVFAVLKLWIGRE